MTWHIYWPHWWKLWPHWEYFTADENEPRMLFFFFGPLQAYWYVR